MVSLIEKKIHGGGSRFSLILESKRFVTFVTPVTNVTKPTVPGYWARTETERSGSGTLWCLLTTRDLTRKENNILVVVSRLILLSWRISFVTVFVTCHECNESDCYGSTAVSEHAPRSPLQEITRNVTFVIYICSKNFFGDGWWRFCTILGTNRAREFRDTCHECNESDCCGSTPGRHFFV